MKLISVTALGVGFLSTASANFDKIKSVFLQLEEAAYNKTIADDPSLANDRGFSSFMLDNLEAIRFYGCWCYLDGDWDLGKGPVQDGLDQECKNLVMNYRCMVMDALERGETCDPHLQDYTEYNLFGGSNDVVGECETNGNENAENSLCRIALCKADGEFSLNLFSLMFQMGGIENNEPPYDLNMAHSNNELTPGGDFKPADECKYDYKGAGRSDKECCGAHPNRFPFKTFNGEKACCGDRTYSTLTMKCCAENPPAVTEDFLTTLDDSCPQNPPNLRGCFRDCQGGSRDLQNFVGSIPANRPEGSTAYCANKCAEEGYLYAGTQFTSQCFCDDRFGTQGQTGAGPGTGGCGMNCNDGTGDKCGGSCRNLVYDAQLLA